MNETPNLGRKTWAQTTSWLLASNIIRNLASIAIVILLARLTDSKTLGDYALALAMTTPIFAFLQFGLKGVYLTLKTKTRFNSFLFVQTTSMVLAIFVSCGVAAISSSQLLLSVFLVSLIKTNDAFSELFSGPLQKYGKPDLIFWAYSASAVLGTSIVAAFLALGFSLNMTLGALAITSITTTLILLFRQSTKLGNTQISALISRNNTSNKELLFILKAGLPTGIAASILSLVVTIPQYQVAASAGTSDVGYLAVMLYGLAIVDIFLGTLTQAWIPRAQDLLHISNSDEMAFGKGLMKSVFLWTGLMVPAAVLGVYLMALIFPPLLGAEFGMSLEIAIPLCVAIVLSPAQHFAGVGLVVKNYYFRSVIPSGLAAFTAALCGYVFVTVLGLSSQGALWAIAFALAVRGSTTLLMVLSRKTTTTKK